MLEMEWETLHYTGQLSLEERWVFDMDIHLCMVPLSKESRDWNIIYSCAVDN